MTPHHVLIGGTRAPAAPREVAAVPGLPCQRSRPQPAGGPGRSAFRHIEADLERPDEAVARVLEVIPGQGPIHGLVFLQPYRGKGDDWEGEITVELTSTKKIIDACVERFVPAPYAAIVTVASNAGKFIQNGGPLSYHVAKAGMVQLALVRHEARSAGDSRQYRLSLHVPQGRVEEVLHGE